MGGHHEKSVKKIAVLFTDIVGSSQYFKSYGDTAGRKMLRQHQDLASPAVIEHGGLVVKLLGDSIMAYFSNPQEALKSAVKIQQKFRGYNQGKDPRNQIHIRIGVHYGDGIVEDNDIFGDVVNMAAKILSLAGGDQIFISDELYQKAQDLSALQAEPVKVSNKKNILEGLTIYKLIWEDAATFDPYAKTLLYIKPVWKLGEGRFSKAWDLLMDKKDRLCEGKIEQESVRSDKSLALVAKTSRLALDLCRDVMKFLHSKLEEDKLPFLPLQIIIDSGPYVRADRLVLGDLKVDWETIEPGKIYISFAAYKTLGESKTFSIFPKPDENHPQSFYELNLNGQPGTDSPLFLYQNFLAQGQYPPCFYCGDRKHLTVECPSKQFSKITRFMKKLGYLPLEKINKLFFNYLGNTNNNIEADGSALGASDQSTQWARKGFFELKMVFQLRFLKALWRTREVSWKKIKENKIESAKGGLAWSGQDCIRVSKLDQAQTILSKAQEKHPNDYRVHCAMGFLKVEKNSFLNAEYYFSRALENAESKPQKIFARFLLSRLFYLNHDLARTEEHIGKILYIDPNCAEAIYQDIILQFKNGRNTEALRRLSKLIKNEREYYVYALIDPELADFGEFIHPELNNLLNEVRDEARQIRAEAEDKVEKLDAQLTAAEKKENGFQALWLKIKELSASDSYFSYLDIIHYCSSIIQMESRHLVDRKTQLLKVINKLESRIDDCFSIAQNLPYPNMSTHVTRKLKNIEAKTNPIRRKSGGYDSQELKDALKEADTLIHEIKQVKSELKRLNSIQNGLLFFSTFFKKCLIFQSVNLLIIFCLFPIFSHYLNFFLPDIGITAKNMWEYQMVVLVLGGLAGLCLALALATKDMPDA
jgi:GGDEF domain-containing protein